MCLHYKVRNYKFRSGTPNAQKRGGKRNHANASIKDFALLGRVANMTIDAQLRNVASGAMERISVENILGPTWQHSCPTVHKQLTHRSKNRQIKKKTKTTTYHSIHILLVKLEIV